MKQKNNKATIIDLQRPYEYEKAHAKGSINIPLNEIPARLEE